MIAYGKAISLSLPIIKPISGEKVNIYTFAELMPDTIRVIGNKYIAEPVIYHLLSKAFTDIVIDERTGLRSVIYTGRTRPDGDDIVLYLERDWDTGKTYLTDLGETDMFIATHKDLEGSKEFRVEVSEKDILEKIEKLLEEIEERFEKELDGFKFGG